MQELIPPHKRTVELTFEIFTKCKSCFSILHFPFPCVMFKSKQKNICRQTGRWQLPFPEAELSVHFILIILLQIAERHDFLLLIPFLQSMMKQGRMKERG